MAPSPLPVLLIIAAAAVLLCPNAAAQSPRNIPIKFPSVRTPAVGVPPIVTPSPAPTIAPPQPASSSSSSSSSTKRSDIAVAVVSTALSSFAVSGLACFLFLRHGKKKDLAHGGGGARYSNGRQDGAFAGGGGGKLPERAPKQPPRGGMVDENGLDAIYWREYEKEGSGGGRGRRPAGGGRPPQPPNRAERRSESQGSPAPSPPRPRKGRVDREPLMPRGSLDSAAAVFDESPHAPGYSSSSSSSFSVAAAEAYAARPPPAAIAVSSVPRPLPPPAPAASSSLAPPPGRASPPPPPPPMATTSPPPPPQAPKGPPPPPAPRGPPPPPPPGGKKGGPPGPPPPPGGKKGGPPPPPAWASSSRPPTAPGGPFGAEDQQAKLKPLHWDKVNVAATDHSMVWDKLTAGSFNLDEGTIEALFGTGAAAANRKTKSADSKDSSSSLGRANSEEKIFLIDSRKSHNISIILKSLTVGRDEIIDALRDGHTELTTDVLEKLSRLTISKDEESAILKFSGNADRLAPAEAFLLRLLLDVPNPFARIDALLFKVNYSSEVAQLKRSLQTLEMASQELRTKGLFLKLLEAVLKAGNRMNAGTARGNAQAFNLAALRKLNDVKSTDGATTLLHFVIEEVVRAEGKRLAVNRNYSIRRSGSLAKTSTDGIAMSGPTVQGPSREERQNEYLNLGLPIVGGLSSEFANVKKAATVDYDSVVNECGTLGNRLTGIKKLLETCGDDGFSRGLRGFVKAAEEELAALTGEQEKVLDLVQRTTEYYHAGAKDKNAHPLQLFVIVRDFLGMVDQACVDIKRRLQQQKRTPPPSSQPTSAVAAAAGKGPADAANKGAADGAASPAQKPTQEEADSKKKRVMPRFPNLPAHFMKDNADSDSSSDEE